MSDKFKITHIPGLFYRADNLTMVAGHARLFGKPLRGWCFYQYAEQAPGWALHRRWNFGLFCIHHVGPGKATDPQGWHVTWASLKLKRECDGVSLRWRKADTFRTRPIR